MIDLRSDTVTRPTPAMREAMFTAEVGDDVYREDPTVNQLEEESAEVFGKEAALFVPTGTMGNTIAIKLHTEHGQEVICEAHCHILDYELAMMAWFAGCVARPIATLDGILTWEKIQRQIRTLSPNKAPTGLIEVENTHNMAGGRVYPLEVLREIQDGAREAGLPVHMDGARVFHAATTLAVPVSEIAACADTVMFCLSKGLGAPAGSILAGPKKLMERGRMLRKRLGGGMRQAGILAAAGLIALHDMPGRLGEDHVKAEQIAADLEEVPGIEVRPVETNIVVIDITSTGVASSAVSRELKSRGVLSNPISPTALRMVTHYDVSAADCRAATTALKEILTGATVRIPARV